MSCVEHPPSSVTGTSDPDKLQAETDIQSLKEENQYLLQGIDILQKVFNPETAERMESGGYEFITPDGEGSRNQPPCAVPSDQLGKILEDLKSHVFGWEKLRKTRRNTEGSVISGSSLAESHPALCLPGPQLRQAIVTDNNPWYVATPQLPSPYMYQPPAHPDNASLASLISTSPPSINLQPVPLRHPPDCSGPQRLHDNIMQQSEVVLQTLKQSGEIKDEAIPAAVFHWQDVRDSIAQGLHDESAQHVHTPPASMPQQRAVRESVHPEHLRLHSDLEQASASMNQASPQDPDMTQTMNSKGRTKEESTQMANSVSSNNDTDAPVQKDSCSTPRATQLLENLADIAKALEQELGTKLNISVRSREGTVIHSKPEDHPTGVVTKTGDQELTEEIDEKRVIKAVPDPAKVSRDYENLRRQRLAMLIKAFTGRDDPEQMLQQLQGLSPDTETPESAKLGHRHTVRDSSDPTTKNTSGSISRNLASIPQLRKKKTKKSRVASKESSSDRVLSRSPPYHNQSVKGCQEQRGHTHSKSKEESSHLPDSVSRTIAAISRDSEKLKQKIRAMTDQLSAAAAGSRGQDGYDDDLDELAYGEVYNPEYVQDELEAAEEELERLQQLQVRYDMAVESFGNARPRRKWLLTSGQLPHARQEIYPHRRGWESPRPNAERELYEDQRQRGEVAEDEDDCLTVEDFNGYEETLPFDQLPAERHPSLRSEDFPDRTLADCTDTRGQHMLGNSRGTEGEGLKKGKEQQNLAMTGTCLSTESASPAKGSAQWWKTISGTDIHRQEDGAKMRTLSGSRPSLNHLDNPDYDRDKRHSARDHQRTRGHRFDRSTEKVVSLEQPMDDLHDAEAEQMSLSTDGLNNGDNFGKSERHQQSASPGSHNMVQKSRVENAYISSGHRFGGGKDRTERKMARGKANVERYLWEKDKTVQHERRSLTQRPPDSDYPEVNTTTQTRYKDLVDGYKSVTSWNEKPETLELKQGESYVGPSKQRRQLDKSPAKTDAAIISKNTAMAIAPERKKTEADRLIEKYCPQPHDDVTVWDTTKTDTPPDVTSDRQKSKSGPAETRRNSNDSGSMSEADFVVTRYGDILKRPKSPERQHHPESTTTAGNHSREKDDIISAQVKERRLNSGMKSTGSSKAVLDEGRVPITVTQRYCDAILRSTQRYQETFDNCDSVNTVGKSDERSKNEKRHDHGSEKSKTFTSKKADSGDSPLKDKVETRDDCARPDGSPSRREVQVARYHRTDAIGSPDLDSSARESGQMKNEPDTRVQLQSERDAEDTSIQ